MSLITSSCAHRSHNASISMMLSALARESNPSSESREDIHTSDILLLQPAYHSKVNSKSFLNLFSDINLDQRHRFCAASKF